MLQADAFDIAEWPADDSFGDIYPEGARSKRTVFSLSETPDCLKPDWRYLFKLSARQYPAQFWVEIIAYHVGLTLGVPVPPAFAAFDSRTGESGALIEWFYAEDEVSFFPGGDLFQRLIPDFDRQRGTQHNLADAMRANDRIVGLDSFLQFAPMLLFDALIGNTDRHQDNWGYIATPFIDADGAVDYRFSFAPWFDNGTSMGHERFLHRVEGWEDGQYRRYVERGRHHMRLQLSSEERLGHLESMRFIAGEAPRLKELLRDRLEQVDLAYVRGICEALVELDMPVASKLDPQRYEFILRLLTLRRELILDALR